ncbi:MAG: DUF1320 domain-containing protein [Odoribacteraceae bacterium]|jgi:phage gp36-like protein|nr:DUF1320 domain-containing protein [Odoribacteraceae bacterium]
MVTTFITPDDYKAVCDDDELDILTRDDPDTRRKAERVAMEEVASYLRPRHDMDKAYAATGDDRNAMLVQVTVNIALYYLAHWLPSALALEGRQELYDRSIDWLAKASKGATMPGLPTYAGENGDTDTSNPVRHGSMPPARYDY